MEKIKIKYPVIVEGRYDKIKLSSIFDGVILTTEGFGIFKNHEKLALLRRMAQKGKIIVLTDSDGAGKLIRSHITSAIPKDKIIQIYTPQIKGKEKRKEKNSAEGYLGVEGVDVNVLCELLKPYCADAEEREFCNITKLDFYNDGLTGSNSKEKRNKLAKILDLPKDMTPNALIDAINATCTLDEYKSAIEKLTVD